MINPVVQSRTAHTGVGLSEFTKLPGHADRPEASAQQHKSLRQAFSPARLETTTLWRSRPIA